MQFFGLDPEIFVFYLSILNLLIIIYLSYQYLKIKQQSGVFTLISHGIDYMLLSILFFLVAIIIGSSDDALSPIIEFNIFEEAVYSIGYLLFLSFWFYGNNTFLNQAVRIPDNRRNFIRISNSIINFLIGILVVLSIISSFSLIIPELQNMELYFDLITFLFGISSQVAILIFIYFIYNINKEKKQNRSKLSKSRLQLVQYSIIGQICVSVIILVGIILLLFVSTGQDQDRFIEGFLFTGINLFLLLSYFILISSLTIPSWVRNNYDLDMSRFSKVQQLYDFLPKE